MQTEDVFMECVNELKEQFGQLPTATQLSEATGLTVAACEQVLSELDLEILPAKKPRRSSASAAKCAAAKTAPPQGPAPEAAANQPSDEEEATEDQCQVNGPVRAVLAGTLDDTDQDDDATLHHPSPGSEMEDDGVVPHKDLPDGKTPSQETPLAPAKRQLSFEDGVSKKPKALRNVCSGGTRGLT